MNESRPSSDRDRDVADAEPYRPRRAEERLEELYAVEADDDDEARAEGADEPSADGDPDDGPRDDLSDGRDAAGPADQAARLLEGEDGEAFARVFEDFEERLAELMGRIAVVLEDGRLDAGRRQALSERIAVSTGHLVDLADAVETDLGRCER